MTTTRTQFLTSIATGLAAAALTPMELLGAGSGIPDGHSLKELVGSTFRFHSGDGRGPVDLVLSDYAERSPSAVTRQFSLTFVAPGGETLREATYSVDHPRAGTIQMFVIPTGRDAKGQTIFRADFNLLMAVTGAPTPVQRR